jgi:hypothetical protein
MIDPEEESEMLTGSLFPYVPEDGEMVGADAAESAL